MRQGIGQRRSNRATRPHDANIASRLARSFGRSRPSTTGLQAASPVGSPLMDVSGLIEVRPGVRSGKPCFVGTRIAVYDVLDYLASGMTHGQILEDFPELSEAHIRSALEFAAVRERRLATPA
jgi:uncharacterized protein (DUF433 family)